ncbi:MAG: hypothetical protein JSS66_17980 [Armatimonadetes bacterium]|nr:hypothetical protein [Armatimonadota bacterium]
MLRRASNHLGEAESAALAKELIAERLSLVARRGTRRPFEPGGRSFSGKSAKERDAQFGQSLAGLIPRLATGAVWTLAEAEAAAKELTSTPLKDVPTGLVFDPVSRDPYRALDGPALSDWIPDVALDQRATVAFETALTAGKSVEAVETAITEASHSPRTGIESLSRFKRLALVKWVRYLEIGIWPQPESLGPKMPEDPIWAVGNTFRLDEGMTPQLLGMDPVLARTAGVELKKPLSLAQSALSWMWVGWTMDPSLLKTTLDPVAQTGTYVNKALWDAGPYPWHAAYFTFRRAFEERKLSRNGQCLRPELNAFVNNDVLKHFAPDDPAFVKFCANGLRMDCLLVDRDRKQRRTIKNADAAKRQLTNLWEFVGPKLATEEATRTKSLLDRTTKALDGP